MKRLGLSCKSLRATLFLAVAAVTAGLRGQDVLNALPPKLVQPAPKPDAAKENDSAFTLSREEPAPAMPAPPAHGEDERAMKLRRMEAFRAQMLQMFDKNGDGRLDETERAAARKYAEEKGFGAGPVPPPANREEMLKRFDKNGDGTLDDEERAAMQAALHSRVAKMAGPAEAMRGEMRRRFDRNGNGKIDDDEMPALEQAIRSRPGVAPVFRQRYDKNGDGKIDDAEWAAARGQIQQWLNEPAKR